MLALQSEVLAGAPNLLITLEPVDSCDQPPTEYGQEYDHRSRDRRNGRIGMILHAAEPCSISAQLLKRKN